MEDVLTAVQATEVSRAVAEQKPSTVKKIHLSKEVIRHQQQIQSRSRKREKDLFGLVSFSSSAGVKSLEFKDSDLMPLGAMTHFVLRRRWKKVSQGHFVVIQYCGYKSRLTDEGRILLGGESNMRCAYDLKYAPFHPASPGGVIIDANKHTTLRLGLDLDAAVEIVADGKMAPSIRLEIPEYYAAFRPDRIKSVETELTPYTRRRVLESLRPNYSGPAHPCTVAEVGGTVKEIVRSDEAGLIIVDLGSEGLQPEFPIHGVARPWLQLGVEVKPGTVLGDILPRAVYNSYDQLVRTWGERAINFVARQTVASLDFVHQGLVLRDVRFCPSQLADAVQIFERAPNVDHTRRAAVQVICEGGAGRSGLRFEEGPITVDLESLREGWGRKFSG
jgi:hypothetical protein